MNASKTLPQINEDFLYARHCIVDLETLGTSRDSHVLSIGAVITDLTGTHKETFYEVLPHRLNGMVDISTVMWWILNPRIEARQDLIAPTVPSSLKAFEAFKTFLQDNKFDYIWGNSASFDLEILKYQLNTFGLGELWKYKQECDLRTLFSLYPLMSPQMESLKLIPHIALNDALFEWEYLKIIFNHVITKEKVKEEYQGT